MNCVPAASGNHAVHLPQTTLPENTRSGLWKVLSKNLTDLLLLFVLLSITLNAQAITPPGTVIDNTANAAFAFKGTRVTAQSNTASVVSTIIATPSTLTLFQYAQSQQASRSLTTVSQYATSGPPGTGFVTSPDPLVPVAGAGFTPFDPDTPQDLVETIDYSNGEPVYILVDDQDQNLDASVRETVIVVVTSPSGDREEILLTETGVDSGEFVGYVQSSDGTVSPYDGVISLTEDSSVSVTYTDKYDPSDSSESVSLVDPIGVVFSSADGALVDGARVTITDADGNAVQVYGDDNISSYPNTVITGGSVTDGSGKAYDFPPGGYRFPRLPVGEYKLQVVMPDYITPSIKTIDELNALPDGPWALNQDSSFAKVFTLANGLNIFVDLPIDPVTDYLVIDKKVSNDTVAIGDFVQYTLNLKNTAQNLVSSNVRITDILPIGLRYQRGSVRINGMADVDPVVAANGRELTFSIASLDPATAVQITYITEVTVGTRLGKAVNSVRAQDDLGAVSNKAVAAITVTEDLFASRSFIAGRVIIGSCDEDAMITNPGLPSVRMFMEDGSYAATDENGRFHFEGITPGTHIVQLDKESIPDNLEIVECVKNTRYAGTAYSQFVDIQGGTLWRTNFYVREKKAITDKATVFIRSELNEEDIKYTIDLSNGEIPVKNYRLIVSLPEGIEYDIGSSVLDSVVIEDPYVNENMVVYRFGDLGDNWNKQLKLRGRIKEKADGSLVTSAIIIVNTDEKKNIRSKPVKNSLQLTRERVESKFTYQAYFEPMGTDLSYMSKKAIRKAIRDLGEVDIISNEITGYTDDRRVQKRSIWLYGNNSDLSKERAKVVRDFLVSDMNIDEDRIVIKGGGASNPIAKNDTVNGRSKNRRAELVLSTSKIVGSGKINLVSAKSEVGEVELVGQPYFKIEKLIEAPPVTEQLDISEFDEFWIKNTTPGYEWLMPDVNYSPAIPSVNLAIKHRPDDKFELLHNGEPINPLFYFGAINNKANTVARSYWQGVHLVDGDNIFEFVVKDETGAVIKTLRNNIVLAGYPVRAELVTAYSRLIADGRNVPVVALRVYDKDGHYARPGSLGEYTLSAPYITQQEVEAFKTNRLSGLNREKPKYIVGQNGVAYIVLEPTTQTGKLEVELPFNGRKKSLLQTWIQPEIRDWIMVGLAEGGVAYNSISGNQEALTENDYRDEFSSEGKVAFYAKGKVKGEWLLTAAYDSSKQKVAGDNRVNQLIDPNTYYTIYGDNSRQRFDASSAEKLYIKVERKQFYAMFGDIDTGLTLTDLSKFNRRMTGIKSEFDNGDYTYTAFAAENYNNFIKDEIQGEGISGLYRLSGKGVVINSESIVIETRDRFRSEIIVKTEAMRRYIDYSIDYADGTLFFKRPIMSRDENFNPVFIVVDYEVEAPIKGDITAGGRASVRFDEGRVEIGASAVHDASYLNPGDLIGADVRYELNEQTEVRLEAATSDVKSGTGNLTGSAFSAQVVHGGDKLKARLYASQQDTDFGLGQQSISQKGTRKYGAEANYLVADKVLIDARVYHEEVFSTGARRDVAEGGVSYNQRNYTLSSGARIAKDDNGLGLANNSNLLMLGASRSFFEDTVKLRANAEIAVNNNNANVDYPSRYILGADYFVTPKVNLFAENEWTDGRSQNTQMARAGVRASPWSNAQVNTAVNQETNENGIRSFATLGLTQSFPITKRLSGDVAFDHARTLRTPGGIPINPNVPIAQGTANNDFTAVSMGTTYKARTYTINNRVEYRAAELEDKYGLIVNWERNLKNGIGYSATTKLFNTDRTDGSGLFNGDIRFSVAHRPLQSRWITLNRLDFRFDSNTDIIGIKTRQRKLIENLTSNFLMDDRNQISFNFGLKYVVNSFGGLEFNGITGLLGSEYRHDLSDVFDIGVHANTYYSANSSVTKYSTGLSFGWNMIRNIWLSVGYNIDGFEDRDFSAAGYTAQGPYIRFRMKFDQDTADEVQKLFN